MPVQTVVLAAGEGTDAATDGHAARAAACGCRPTAGGAHGTATAAGDRVGTGIDTALNAGVYLAPGETTASGVLDDRGL